MNPTELQQKLGKAAERARKWKGEHRRLEGISRGETRKRDTRRKIWIGAWVLKEMRDNSALRQKFAEHIRTAKLRNGEAALFAEFIDAAPERADARAGAVCPRTPEDTDAR